MADVLAGLLAGSRPANLPVALRHDQVLDWAGFLLRVQAWAALLAGLPGQRWALHCDDAAEAAIRLFGAWAAGKTVVLPGDALPATVARLDRDVSGWLAGVAHAPSEPPRADFRFGMLPPDLPALEVFTSGSTGEPVAIPKTLRQLDAEVACIDACWADHLRGTRMVATVPHQHLYGLLFRILWPLAAARPFEAIQRIFPEQVAEALAAGPCVLVSSPAFLKRWPEALDLRGAPRSPVVVFSSGGPLALDASRAVQQRLGCEVIEVYGSSETGGIAARVQHGPQQAWRVHAGIEIDFASDGMRLRSPFMPDPSAWYATADRAEPTADGFLLLGRADRIVKIEEKRVSLDAVESALLGLPELREVRVCPLPDGRLGAVLVLSEAGHQRHAAEGAKRFHAGLRHAIADRFDPVALPRRWRHVAALPLNAMGKTPLALLQALFIHSPEMAAVLSMRLEGLHAEILLDVPAGLAAFDGHFPGTPILPGVVQIEWALRHARACFAIEEGFRAMEALKFHRAIRPDSQIRLQLEHLPARSAVSFRILEGEQLCSSGRFVFGAAS